MELIAYINAFFHLVKLIAAKSPSKRNEYGFYMAAAHNISLYSSKNMANDSGDIKVTFV